MQPDIVFVSWLTLLLVGSVGAGLGSAVTALVLSRRARAQVQPPSTHLIEQRLEELESDSARSQRQIADLESEREFLRRLLQDKTASRVE